MSIKPAPVEVFYVVAQDDQDMCSELDKHLILLQQDGLITTWHSYRIAPGMDIQAAIDQHLATARIILFLISPDFLASNYATGIEVQRAMQRYDAGEARVIPILLRPVDWQHASFGKLKALPDNGIPITKWLNRDDAFQNVVTGIRAVLKEIPHSALNAPSTTLPRVWNIPYSRNLVFTGREEVLIRLTDALKTGQPAALSQPQAISGLGGIGKTQVAVEYAYQHHQEYEAILWTSADTRKTLISGYVVIAHVLHLPEKIEQDQMVIVQAVIDWLATHSDWLLIFDNVEDLMLVREFLPSFFGGHIILTTRAWAMGRLARRIQIDPLEQDTGALLLLRRAGLLAPHSPLEDASIADVTLAKIISKELGGLPLALDQAGAYIEETQCSLVEYQRLYHIRRAALLHERGGLVADHPDSVATTWSLCFQKIEQSNPSAADLLRFCAFLHPDAIPEELLATGVQYLRSSLQPLATDPLLLNKAISTLGAYSLLQRNATENTLKIHRLVQAVLRDNMDTAVQREWAIQVVCVVNAAFPAVMFTTWQQCERCLPHALECATLIDQWDLMLLEAASLLSRVGWYLYNHTQYRETEPLHRRALAIREQLLGPEHPETAASLNNLANFYMDQGKYELAEPLHMRALAIREQQLGPEHPSTAQSLNNLANLYMDQGKYEPAELLHMRALEIRKQQLGPEHPDTTQSLNNLANLYVDQGKYEFAEPLHRQVLTIREQQLGPEHPETTQSLNNLAILYKKQGKYELAEPLYKRALEIREQLLGPEHLEHCPKSEQSGRTISGTRQI